MCVCGGGGGGELDPSHDVTTPLSKVLSHDVTTPTSKVPSHCVATPPAVYRLSKK